MEQDIELYKLHPDEYIKVQSLRPDYKYAIDTTVELALKYTSGKNNISVADLCGGIGNTTKRVADNMPLDKAVVIDINSRFLEIAKASGIKAQRLETICSNVLFVSLKNEFDLILSVFAYHHVPDQDKEKYLKNVLSGLKQDGVLLMTEIYLPTKEITLDYYDKLRASIPVKHELLDKFLIETANSKIAEYKVSKEFAEEQLAKLGFSKMDEVKIWPLDNTFEDSIGTFVHVFKISINS